LNVGFAFSPLSTAISSRSCWTVSALPTGLLCQRFDHQRQPLDPRAAFRIGDLRALDRRGHVDARLLVDGLFRCDTLTYVVSILI
jgi:hypothetical protein